ncbi:MAG: PspC domain-containing protein [Caldilineales bacterium]|nr:PspC domain-containing protein [Caldilineales bacterium]
MTSKRLYRSRQNQMVAGVCSGIGDYLGIDPTLIRLAFLFLALWGGGGLLAYIIAWVVIPEEPLDAGMGAAIEPAPKVVEEAAETLDVE